MTKKTSSLPVLMTHLGAAFHCAACGDCCRGSWRIQMDERSFHEISFALEHRPHPLPLRAADTLRPLAQPEPSAYAYLAKRPDGSCVFLDTDNLCYLHKHFGPEVKPPTCRTFPYRPVKRPDGVFAPASLACTTMRKNLMALAEGGKQGPAPSGLVEVNADRALSDLAYDRYSPGAPALLAPGRPARIELVQLIEERMARLLGEQSLPLPTRLLGVRYLIEEIVHLPDERITPKLVELCHERVIGTAGTGYAPLRERVARVVPHVRLHLGLVFQLLSEVEQSMGRGEQQPLCRRQAVHFGFGLPLTEQEHDEVVVRLYGWRYTVAETGLQPVVVSYLIERLRASNLTGRFGLVGMAQGLVFGAALLRFLACGRAGAQQREVTLADLMGAIEEVDSMYFHNVPILSRFGADGPALQRDLRTAELLTVLPPAPPQQPDAGPPQAPAGEPDGMPDGMIDRLPPLA